MLLIISLVLNYLVTRSLYLLISYSPYSFHNPSTLVTTHNLIPFSITHTHTNTFKIPHISEIIQYLSDLFHLAQCPQGPPCSCKLQDFLIFMAELIIFHCVYMRTCVYYSMIYIHTTLLSIPALTLKWFSYLGCCK